MARSVVGAMGLAMLLVGCSGQISDGTTKEQAAQAADSRHGGGTDECEQNGWYGDGVCDTFCPHHDPDCGSGGGGDSCGCGDSCTPTTCLAQGANCGSISDGCSGTLDCGSCSGTDTCGGTGTANTCGTACVPTTCAAAGAQCGSLSDGCGGTLDCGTCSDYATCGTVQANVCEPAPYLNWHCTIDVVVNGVTQTTTSEDLCSYAADVTDSAEYAFCTDAPQATGTTSCNAYNCVSDGCCWNGCNR